VQCAPGARQPRVYLIAAMFTVQTPFAEVLTVVRQQPVAVLAHPGARPMDHFLTREGRWRIGSDPDRAAATDRDFHMWLRDLHAARDVILHRCARTTEGRLVNDLGEVAAPGLTRALLLAHVLRGAERAMLSAVADEFADQIKLRDDALVSASRIEARRARRAIAARTGYRIGVTCKSA
jgi:hypothetical protein